jgi:hypothetical protein
MRRQRFSRKPIILPTPLLSAILTDCAVSRARRAEVAERGLRHRSRNRLCIAHTSGIR